MNTANFPMKRERKQKEAKVRQAASDKLTPQQKLEKLDGLFGENKGATKERLKLHSKVAQAKAEAEAAKVVAEKKAENTKKKTEETQKPQKKNRK